MKAKTKNKEKKNYLDFIPFQNVKSEYDDSASISENDGSDAREYREIMLCVENKGFFNSIAQKCFKKPRVTKVHLDKMGNFIWPLIDGKKSIYDIASYVKEEFGDEAEPLYERLTMYMKILENYGFIGYKA